MKYTDRKKTPLKWHHALIWFLLPLLILARGYITLGMTSELMGFHLPFVTNYLELLLSASGVLITNLGSWFWPVTGIYMIEIVLFIWIIFIWIGMLRWKNKTRIQWLIYLLLETAASGFLTYFIYERLVVDEHYLLVMPLLESIHLVPPFIASHLSLFIAILLFFTLLSAVILVMNVIYYHKRRFLFTAHYTKPEEQPDIQEKVTEEPSDRERDASHKEQENEPADMENTVVLKTNTIPAEDENKPETSAADDQPVSLKEEIKNPSPAEDSSMNTDTQKEPELPAASPNEEEQTPVHIEENSEENAEQTLQPDDHVKDSDNPPDEEMLYCPNCGARLGKYDQKFCTHCGTRLRD